MRIAALLANEGMQLSLDVQQLRIDARLEPENQWFGVEYANAIENQSDRTCALEDFEPCNQESGIYILVARQRQMGCVVQIAK